MRSHGIANIFVIRNNKINLTDSFSCYFLRLVRRVKPAVFRERLWKPQTHAINQQHQVIRIFFKRGRHNTAYDSISWLTRVLPNVCQTLLEMRRPLIPKSLNGGGELYNFVATQDDLALYVVSITKVQLKMMYSKSGLGIVEI